VNDIAEKAFGVRSGKFHVEANDDHLLDAENSEIRQALVERLQQRGRVFRVQHGPRVRVEGDHRWNRLDRPRPLDDRLHDPLMPEMKPVKNAER
jgi:hypothetical protein